jgi:eukaryotic-like serine/threonine-protein kinase
VDLRRFRRRETDKSHPAIKAKRPQKGPTWLSWKTAGIAGIVLLLAGVAAIIAGMSGPSGIATPVSIEQITFTNDTKGAPIVTDGTRLYFQSSGQSVEMSVQGGQAAPLRASLAEMTILDISPDGSQFLAQRDDLPNDETNSGSLWTVAVLGGSPRKLGNQTARGASWSPDGKLIAYTDSNSVFASDSNGANFREIWKAGHYVQGRPSFSPNSQRIYVEVGAATFSDTPKIWELNADGSNARPLLLVWPADADQQHGRWTPDGKHFVFTSYRDSPNNDIYELIQPRWFQVGKKATAVHLTSGQLGVLGFAPSRDNSGLFFIGRIPEGATEIYDQKENRFVSHLNGLSASVILVSPDKQWMVYSDFPRHFLWRSKLDGSEKLQLTQIPVFMPQWSPDSKKIAFSDFKEISMVSIDGDAPEKLTSEGNFSPT